MTSNLLFPGGQGERVRKLAELLASLIRQQLNGMASAVIVVLEDVHWMDKAGWDLLTTFIQHHLKELPVHLVRTAN